MHTYIFSRSNKSLIPSGENKFLMFLYFSRIGKIILRFIRNSYFSQCMGIFFQARWSRFLIPFLIKKFTIDTSTYELPVGGFESIQSFFIRKSMKHYRIFPPEQKILRSPVDWCLEITHNISNQSPCVVKWSPVNLHRLFGPGIADFSSGDLYFFRLRFSDYHRFHFFDDGEILSSQSREGLLYSVDNAVLKTGFWVENKSHLMRLKTENFGEILWLEVGATNVGSITNHLWVWERFSRWQEKWFFGLGGSAVLILFQKNVIRGDEDLLRMSQDSIETEIITGESIGTSL